MIDKLEFGKIDTETREFITTRRPEHFFKKGGGFCISSSQIQEILKKGVEKIRFVYFGVRGIKEYVISVDKLNYLKAHFLNGADDPQIIFPLKEMVELK